MMWEAAARKIRQRGGKLLLGRELKTLAFDPNRRLWRIETATAKGERESYMARHVISSAPIRELMEAITPRPLSYLHAR